MKKRICVSILTFAMSLVLLTACGELLDILGIAEAPRPAQGSWEGNIFTSEHLGLRFTMPASWEAASEAEMLLMVANMFTLEDDSLYLSGGDGTYYDMVATNHNTGASVEIYFVRHGGSQPPTASETVDGLIELNQQMGGTIHPNSRGIARLGTYDWHFVDSEFRMWGTTFHDRHFIMIKDGFISNIRIIYDDESELREVIQSLFGEMTGVPQVQYSQELVGTWLWDEGIAYKNIFRADGHGTRGFHSAGWELEDFRWRTFDSGHLLIETEFMIESWAYSISDGVLTLDSSQFGEKFNYLSESIIERADELMGTWAWDEDDTYTLTFQPDGQGEKGFAVPDEFDWRTEGSDHLLIYPWWGGFESWTYTINGDILTITDRDFPDATYSYIRQ